MRIIAGIYGGRIIKGSNSPATHPMSERIRGAMFNMLGDIAGLKVLDAFAGTGAIGIEAISRGADQATLVERSPKTFKILKNNVESINDIRLKAVRANVVSWSKNNQGEKFDIIICDPPFDNIQLSTLNELTKHLKSTGTMILSMQGRELAPTVNGVVVVDTRNYGDAALTNYRPK